MYPGWGDRWKCDLQRQWKGTFILIHVFCCFPCVSSYLSVPDLCVFCFSSPWQFNPKRAEIVIDFNSINHPGMLNSASKWKCKQLTLGSCWMRRGSRGKLTRLKGTLMPLFCMSSCPPLCPKENSRIPRLWPPLIFWLTRYSRQFNLTLRPMWLTVAEGLLMLLSQFCLLKLPLG